MNVPEVSRALVVAAGKFHDIGFVRENLENLLRVKLGGDDVPYYEDFTALRQNLTPETFLVTYTNNVFPDEEGIAQLRSFLQSGGRWLALHCSAAYTEFKPPPVNINGVRLPGRSDTPDRHPRYMDLIGCRMVSHLTSQEFVVEASAPEHPLVAGLGPFTVFDEPFILELRGASEVLLQARYVGESPGYVRGPWLEDEPRPQLVLNHVGAGSVAYLALGHCRGPHDMRPLVDEVSVQRCSWAAPEFMELLTRLVAWGTRTDMPRTDVQHA